jgi:predicted nucleic acid-binding protein
MQERILKEKLAIRNILKLCDKGICTLLSSYWIDYELDGIKDEVLLKYIKQLFQTKTERIPKIYNVEMRAEIFYHLGIGKYDALHLAIAEAGEADAFLSADDKLIKKAKLLNLKMTINNPYFWQKEYENEHKRHNFGTRPIRLK